MSATAVGTATGTVLSFAEALCAAHEDAMRADDSIVLLGQDIEAGFPFGATKGLVDLFGTGRVRNTPISEAATMGIGVGAALGGIRTVVEVDYSGFLLLGFDQLINNGAKMRYMSGDQVDVPLVVRVGQGPLGSFAAQHSQTQHAYLASVPGLVVLAPATPQDAYDALRWALRQPNPVVLMEDMRLYRHKGTVVRGDAPESIGPRVRRNGVELTVAVYGYGLGLAEEAANKLAHDGLSIEIVDLGCLNPLDPEVLVRSVRHTRRVLCLTDDPVWFGVGSTLSTIVTAEAYDVLEVPPVVLGSRPVPTPYSADLERLVFPTVESVVEAIRRLMAWEG